MKDAIIFFLLFVIIILITVQFALFFKQVKYETKFMDAQIQFDTTQEFLNHGTTTGNLSQQLIMQ